METNAQTSLSSEKIAEPTWADTRCTSGGALEKFRAVSQFEVTSDLTAAEAYTFGAATLAKAPANGAAMAALSFAAAGGHKWAMIGIMARLAELAESGSLEDNSTFDHKIYLTEWDHRLRCLYRATEGTQPARAKVRDAILMSPIPLEQEFGDREEAIDHGSPAPTPLRRRSGSRDLIQEARTAPAAEPSNEPIPGSRTVIERIGDPHTNEGTAITKRYAHVVGIPIPPSGRVPERDLVGDVVRARWPWAGKLATRLELDLALSRLSPNPTPTLRPLLLVGPPGGGKTSVCYAIADAIGLVTTTVAVAGANDAGGLNAFSRGWSTSRPCAPFVAMAQHNVCNPMVVIDEIDKGLGFGAQNGSVAGALLGMIGGRDKYADACLLADVDLSAVSFIATANDLDSIPDVLLERFEIVEFGSPVAEHFDLVLENIRADECKAIGLPPEFMPTVPEEQIDVLRRTFGNGTQTMRQLKRAYRDLIAAQALTDAAFRN